jgi:hypothetical protein
MPRMSQAARVATDTAKHAPGYVRIFDHELACLYALPGWMLRLFVHLVELTNFRTGAGSTHLADLVQLMTPLQSVNGGPRHFVPDEWACRRALLAFERAHILARDKRRSERERFLFFMVSPRVAKVRPSFSSAGQFRRGVDGRKASIHAG